MHLGWSKQECEIQGFFDTSSTHQRTFTCTFVYCSGGHKITGIRLWDIERSSNDDDSDSDNSSVTMLTNVHRNRCFQSAEHDGVWWRRYSRGREAERDVVVWVQGSEYMLEGVRHEDLEQMQTKLFRVCSSKVITKYLCCCNALKLSFMDVVSSYICLKHQLYVGSVCSTGDGCRIWWERIIAAFRRMAA